MEFKISWTDLVGYYTIIEAKDKDTAIIKFNNGEVDSCEPDGYVELQEITYVEELR